MNLKPVLMACSLIAAACGDAIDDPISTAPSVLSFTPMLDATGVAINTNITATFSEPMNRATLTTSTFTLNTIEPSIRVPGTVISSDSKVSFWPAAHLANNTKYTATVREEIESAAGVPLASGHAWTFTTGAALEARLPVELGTSAGFAILAKSAISTVPTSAVTGDIGVSPSAATFITGFALTMDATNAFSLSPQVIGKVYAADYMPPTPSTMTTAISDMELAFTDAAGRAPDVTELGAGNIGGMTLESGVYKWGTGLLIPTNLTLTGSATDVWIFQIAGDLTVESAVNIILAGGARHENVFWQVAGFVDIGTTAHLEGIVLSQTAITLRTGASIKGRLLAQTAVTIDASTVVQ